jgi:hypothetical protein
MGARCGCLRAAIVTERLAGPNRCIRTRVVGIPIIWVAHERLTAAANRHGLADQVVTCGDVGAFG